MKNFYKLIISIIFLFVFPSLYAQDIYEDWVKYGGTQNYFLRSATKTDASANIYQAGATISDNGDYDVLITKYDRGGNEIWSETYDANGYNDAAIDVYIDQSSNVYIAGKTYNPNTSGYSLLILKYNSNGILIWDEVYNYSSSLYNVAT